MTAASDLEQQEAQAKATPDDAGAWLRLGRSQRQSGELEDAMESFQRALELHPGTPTGLAYLVDVARSICDWETAWAAASEAISISLARPHLPPALTPFTSLLFPIDPAVHRQLTEQWVRHNLATPTAKRPARSHNRTGRRLRIGYLSADFRNHPVAHLAHRLFEHHDRDHFDVRCYSVGPDDNSGYRHHIAASCDRFLDLHGTTDTDASSRLHAEGLDILIDMSGHTAFSRLGLLASRPAPVQIHYLGYPGTTGAKWVDWFVTDDVTSPPEAAHHFTERLLRMPHSYQVNAPPHAVPDPIDDRRAHGLPVEGVVFCCFNSSYKIDPSTLDVWLRIVQRVPGAVLWIVSSNRFVEARLRRAARARGVDDACLVFTERVARPEHLSRHRLGDIALDTLHVSGHTTTSDALRMGVPVVTKPGEAFISRVTASLLTTIGAGDLVCSDIADYEETAVRLGRSVETRIDVSRRLREGARRSPLFDTARFVRAFETGLETIWSLHQEADTCRQVRITPWAG
jgi:protein O-GlcNAc transferase